MYVYIKIEMKKYIYSNHHRIKHNRILKKKKKINDPHDQLQITKLKLIKFQSQVKTKT
jgi:hypothetical protein